MKRSIAWLASAAAVISFLFSGCVQNTVSGPASEYENWTYRNDVPEDALDFIDIELAKSITEQLGGKIMPLDEAVKTKVP